MMDIAGATRAVAAAAAEDVTGQRKAKTKAQEKLRARQALGEIAGNSRAKLPEVEKRKEVKVRREPKAGYCENCREKFEDFEEVCSPLSADLVSSHELTFWQQHTQSRRHRKFATGKENWAELDQLLMSLQRPLRKRGRDDTESDEEHRCWSFHGIARALAQAAILAQPRHHKGEFIWEEMELGAGKEDCFIVKRYSIFAWREKDPGLNVIQARSAGYLLLPGLVRFHCSATICA